MSDVKITKPVAIIFAPNGIAYVLDALAKRPFNEVNGLIADILGQIRKSESPPGSEGGSDGEG